MVQMQIMKPLSPLTNRSQLVAVNGSSYNYTVMTPGVQQESHLGLVYHTRICVYVYTTSAIAITSCTTNCIR